MQTLITYSDCYVGSAGDGAVHTSQADHFVSDRVEVVSLNTYNAEIRLDHRGRLSDNSVLTETDQHAVLQQRQEVCSILLIYIIIIQTIEIYRRQV